MDVSRSLANSFRFFHRVFLIDRLSLHYSEIELWTGLVCGCFPALRPLLHQWPAVFSNLSQSFKGSRTKASSGLGGSREVKIGWSWFKASNGDSHDSSKGDVVPLKTVPHNRSYDGEYLELSEPRRVASKYSRRGGQEDTGAQCTADGRDVRTTTKVDMSRSQV